MIYHPPGMKALTAGQLGTEFLTELIEALLISFLLAHSNLTGFGSRFGFVIAAALMAVITTNIPYWNWYGFPTTYTATYAMTQIVGYIVAGLVAIAVLKQKPTSARMAAAA